MVNSKTEKEIEDIRIVAESGLDFSVLKNKTVMISGGTGFIGSSLVDVILYINKIYGYNIDVVVLSRSERKNRDNIKFVLQDLSKPNEITIDADYIIHLASNTHPVQYANDPVGSITTNIYGCDALLRAAAASNAKFILASSVEIYGRGATAPITEDFSGYIDCNTARAGYNESKRVCESLCQSYRMQYGVQTITARFSRVFGADRKNDSKAMAQFIDNAVHGKDIVLNSRGDQRFSYCYISDAVSGLLKLIIDGTDGEAYNISGDYDGETLGGYARYIASLGHVNVITEIRYDAGVSKSDYAVVDCEKIKAIGWRPYYSIKSALKRTYEIMRERLNVAN